MSEIQELEAEIKNAEEMLDRRNVAIKLSNNREFRKLFHDEYFVVEAARLVQLSADPILTVDQRADALAMAQATGHAKRYMSMAMQMGAVAERELPAMRAALEELRGIEVDG